MQITPSILGQKKYDIESIEKVCSRIQFDVADGKFVKNKQGFTPKFVKNFKTKLIKEVHLMTLNPERQIYYYKKAGAKIIFIHVELKKTNKLIQLIKKHKLKVGLAIKNKTKIEKLKPFLDKIDEIIVMGIIAGKSGQPFIPSTLNKVKKLRKITPLPICVDGGISEKNIKSLEKAGATRVVMASQLWNKKDPVKFITKVQ